MRIGLFAEGRPAGPRETDLGRLGEELERLGHRVIAFRGRAPRRPGALEAAVSASPSAGRSAQWIAERLGVPHLFLFPGGLLERWLSLPPALRPPLRAEARRALSLARRCTAVGVRSKVVWDELVRAGVRTPIHPLPWGLDPTPFSRLAGGDLRRDLVLPPTARVLLQLGELSRGGRFALGMFRAIAEMRRDVALVMVGADPAAEELAAEAHRLGIASRVRLVGEVEPALLADYYRQADVLVCPTRGGPVGPVLAAMAAGLPVVAIPGPGLAGLVEPGENALLAPEDEPAFARVVLELVADGELRARLRAAGMVTAAAHSPAALARRVAGTLSALEAH